MRLPNFFADQRHYTKMSWLFYGLLFVSVLMQFLLLLLLAGVVGVMWLGSIELSLFVWLVIIFMAYLLTGAMVNANHVKQGGMSVAKSAQAVRIFVHPDSDTLFDRHFIRVPHISQLPDGYQRYYEFATQMSIASGVPLPKLYVLPFESGVNAFVAGFHEHDTVMVLTQGAVDGLDNAQLYGLIGHEFGHLLHGDSRLNLKIYIMLGMLSWVYDLADVAERWVFGEFDKDYHRRDEPVKPIGNDKVAWVSYLKNQRKQLSNWHAHHRLSRHRHDSDPEAEAVLFFPYLIMATPIVLFRMLGVMGMAMNAWIVRHFNHRREYLADATCVQLTRSYEVVEALQGLHRHDTALKNHAFGVSMSHFFFADPKGEDSLHSHPSVHDRICAIDGRWYDDMAHTATHHLSVLDRQSARQYALSYTIEPDTSTPIPQPDVDVDDVYQMAMFDNEVCAVYSSVATDISDIKDIVFYPDFVKTDLPWHIQEALRTPMGRLDLLACVLVCAYHQKVSSDSHAHQIYRTVRSADVQRQSLPDELLRRVARQDRHFDGLYLLLCCRQMSEQVLPDTHQAMILTFCSDKYESIAKRSVYDSAFFIDRSSDFASPLEKLTKACVLALLCQTAGQGFCQKVSHATHDRWQDRLTGLGLADCHEHLLVMLMAFVVGIQDNSLRLGQHERLLQTLRRLCRLQGVDLRLSDETLVVLMYELWCFDEVDWLCVLLYLEPTPTLAETLFTAFLFDGDIHQKECDVVGLCATLWGQDLPDKSWWR